MKKKTTKGLTPTIIAQIDLYPGSDQFTLKYNKKTEVLKIVGTKEMDFIVGSMAKDILKGKGGEDTLHARGEGDRLYGGAGPDRLAGTEHKDFLHGGKGDDAIIGSWGKDILVGGKGADVFFFAPADSWPKKGQRDVIRDFKPKQDDLIHLVNGFDFHFIGKKEFSEEAGELRFDKKKKKTFVWGDEDGDGKADFGLELKGSINLKRDDFALEAGDYII